MYIAVVADGRVVSIESNEAASLETMRAVANRRFERPRQVVRFATDARVFIDYSNGRESESIMTFVTVGWSRESKGLPDETS